MEAFTLDTSGDVRVQVGSSGGETEFARYRWHNLDPFTQGYIEALFADFARAAPVIANHGVRGGQPVAFSDLAPETLARIIAVCAAATSDYGYIRTSFGGRAFWSARAEGKHLHPQAGFRAFPPLTPTLGDDGKIYLREPV